MIELNICFNFALKLQNTLQISKPPPPRKGSSYLRLKSNVVEIGQKRANY